MADDDVVDILARRFRQLDRALRDRSPLDRNAKYGTDVPLVGPDVLDEYADAIYGQLAQKAWTTYVDQQDTAEVNARTSADNALSGRVSSLEGDITQKAWTTYVDSQNAAQNTRLTNLETEVTAARGTQANIDARLDAIEAKNADQDTKINNLRTSLDALIDWAAATQSPPYTGGHVSWV